MTRPLNWLLALALTVGTAHADPPYHVHESANGLDVVTPTGEHFYVGDAKSISSGKYRFKIPLEVLKPRRQPASVPTPAPAAAPTTVVIEREKAAATAKEETEEEKISSREERAKDSDVMAFIVEANRLYNRGRFNEALSVVDEVLRRRPDHLRAWLMKGSLLNRIGQKDLAREAWQKAEALSPDDENIKNLWERYP